MFMNKSTIYSFLFLSLMVFGLVFIRNDPISMNDNGDALSKMSLDSVSVN